MRTPKRIFSKSSPMANRSPQKMADKIGVGRAIKTKLAKKDAGSFVRKKVKKQKSIACIVRMTKKLHRKVQKSIHQDIVTRGKALQDGMVEKLIEENKMAEEVKVEGLKVDEKEGEIVEDEHKGIKKKVIEGVDGTNIAEGKMVSEKKIEEEDKRRFVDEKKAKEVVDNKEKVDGKEMLKGEIVDGRKGEFRVDMKTVMEGIVKDGEREEHKVKGMQQQREGTDEDNKRKRIEESSVFVGGDHRKSIGNAMGSKSSSGGNNVMNIKLDVFNLSMQPENYFSNSSCDSSQSDDDSEESDDNDDEEEEEEEESSDDDDDDDDEDDTNNQDNRNKRDGQSALIKGSSSNNCVIRVMLRHYLDSPLGFHIEGGSDTPLKYICIQSLEPGTPASACKQFQPGDQLVIVGDSCLIGLTLKEAKSILASAPAKVEVIAQRKVQESVMQSPLTIPNTPVRGKNLPSRKDSSRKKRKTRLSAVSKEMVNFASSTDHLPGVEMEVEMWCSPGEIFGIVIIGGRDDPYLKNIHVSMSINI